MAEITMPDRNGRKKKQTPRIDFTPMVDLGFLLITFFIYTTTIARPNAIPINRPVDGPPTELPEESTITLIPVKQHAVVYYEGKLDSEDKLKRKPIADIRTLLLGKKKQVAALPASYSKAAHLLHVLIKPNADCRYEDVVQLLDEMDIAGIDTYIMMDIAPAEKELVEKKF